MPAATASRTTTNSRASSTELSYARRGTRYAERIVAGKILASKWVRLACKRHLAELKASRGADYRWKYDDKKANAVCTFVELLPHQKGELQGQRVQLEDWQCFILCSLFGWVDKRTGFRRFREAFLLVARGNGKSPMAAWIGLWMAFLDGEKGSEVYCGAGTKEQALEVFRVARGICVMTPKLVKQLAITVAIESLFQVGKQSVFKPVVGRPKDGASVHLGILDELHQQRTGEQYDTFVTGANKRKGSLILIISTAGNTTEGPCHSRQQDIEKVLEGTVQDDRIFGLIYTADPEIDWTSREALEMANPNLYVSMDTEAMVLAQAEAARNPSKQNAFRNKHLNQWTNSATTWMNMVTWGECADPSLAPEQFKDADCYLGSDLASKLDLAATAKVFRRDIDGLPHYYAFCRAYTPQYRVDDPANRHYQKWAAEGWLTATPGSSLYYAQVEKDTIEDIGKFRVKQLAFDARYADQYAQRVNEATGTEIVEVPPSPSEFSPAMKELESAVADGRFHFDGNPVLTWCMGNLISEEWGGSGNYRMPDKQRPESKIDCAVALLIAISQARRMPVAAEYTWSPEVWA